MLLASLLHLVTEDLKGREHLSIRVMGITPARIRQEKYLRSGKLPGGQSKIEWAFHIFFRRKEHAENRDPQESYNRRSVESDFSFQARNTSPILNRVEDINPCGTAADDICEAELPFRQMPILAKGQGFAD